MDTDFRIENERRRQIGLWSHLKIVIRAFDAVKSLQISCEDVFCLLHRDLLCNLSISLCPTNIFGSGNLTSDASPWPFPKGHEFSAGLI